MGKRDDEFEKEEARRMRLKYDEASGFNQNPDIASLLFVFILMIVAWIICDAIQGDDTQADAAGGGATAAQTTQK